MVTVRWSLRLDGSAGEVVGVSPTSGVEVFQDGVDHVDILLSPLPQGPPSPVQVCAAVLASPSGGALLADPSSTSLLVEQRIVIADSGSAYGIVDLVPDNCSLIVVRSYMRALRRISTATGWLLAISSLFNLVYVCATQLQ